MSIARVNTDYLTGAADAIRRKTGSQEAIPLPQFESEIDALPTAPTLIPKTITQNGVYNASSDNVDGYSQVTVNVPDHKWDIINSIMGKTITYFKTDYTGYAPFIGNSFYGVAGNTNQTNLKFFSMKNVLGLIGRTFCDMSALNYCRFGCYTTMNVNDFRNVRNCTLIMTSTTMIPLAANQAFNYNTNIFYVPDSLKSSYQNATNWANKSDKIFGFNDAPTYDATTTYSIGDVCQYNGRFYGYCKKDLTSSTGNPPTGTTADNDYWEYIADIEVI